MQATRRDFLATAFALWQAASCRAQEHLHRASAAAPASTSYTFQVFTSNERATLCQLLTHILPADDRSTGAIGANVDQYIDFVLSHSDPALQTTWRAGLKNYAAALKQNDINTFLTEQAKYEFSPETQDQHFFVLLKAAIVEGFYTSEEGIEKELGYKGMTFNLDWRGCTHTAHHAPADWKPLLRQIKDQPA